MSFPYFFTIFDVIINIRRVKFSYHHLTEYQLRDILWRRYGWVI